MPKAAYRSDFRENTNFCPQCDSNLGPLAQQASALPLDQCDLLTYLYLLCDCFQCKGRRVGRWEDPTTWVATHLPWPAHPEATDSPALLRLRSEDFGGGFEVAPSSVDQPESGVTTAADRQMRANGFDTGDPLVGGVRHPVLRRRNFKAENKLIAAGLAYNNNNNNNNHDDIYSAVIYGASYMREFTLGHLDES